MGFVYTVCVCVCVRLRVRVRVRACRIPADVERLKQLKHVVVVFAIPRHANYRNAYASNA